MGQGVRARSTRWQGSRGIAEGRRARWQLLGMVGQEGGLAGGPDGRLVGQKADGREQERAGPVGQGGLDGQEEEDGRVHEGQMAVGEPSPVVLKMYSGFLGLVYFSSAVVVTI